VTFPALKLSNLIQLFLGGTADLVLVAPPKLEANKEFNIQVPIFSAGIPYVAEVYIAAFFGGGFHLKANVSAGFDTSGLKRGSFLSGIYLGDFDPRDGVLDPDDPERPELTLSRRRPRRDTTRECDSSACRSAGPPARSSSRPTSALISTTTTPRPTAASPTPGL